MSTLAPGDKPSCPTPVMVARRLLAVRHPDIFDLTGVLQIPAAFTVPRIGKIDFAALVGPDLLQVPGRQRLGHGTKLRIPVAPKRSYIVVFGQYLQQFGCRAGDQVDDSG